MKTPTRFIIAASFITFVSCGHDFLDVRRDANQVVPSNLEDYQALLDNNSVMNSTSFALITLGGDEHVASDIMLSALSINNRWQVNGYTWARDVFEGLEVSDWDMPFQRILYANMALDAEKLTLGRFEDSHAKDAVVGQALFHRAWNMYQLAQAFCKPYDEPAASNDLGLPIRLDYDVSMPVARSSLKETYSQILRDLREAEILLPLEPGHQFRPGKAAAKALLARVSLHMEDYHTALAYADGALQFSHSLLDFNTLDTNARQLFADRPYGNGNPEVIFFAHDNNVSLVSDSRLNVDSVLYGLYEANDLRKPAYFFHTPDGRTSFKGSYRGAGTYFTGLAVDELYLIRAECLARLGQLDSSADAINELLKHRYAKGKNQPVAFQDQSTALDIVMREKRKELFLRGTRWDDLRRWNKHSETATTLYRVVAGKRYELRPDDPRWVWPLPDNEVELSGLRQNTR